MPPYARTNGDKTDLDMLHDFPFSILSLEASTLLEQIISSPIKFQI